MPYLSKTTDHAQQALNVTRNLLERTKKDITLARQTEIQLQKAAPSQFQALETKSEQLYHQISKNFQSINNSLHNERLAVAREFEKLKNTNANDPATAAKLAELKATSEELRKLSSQVSELQARVTGQLIVKAPSVPNTALDEKEAKAYQHQQLLKSMPSTPKNDPKKELLKSMPSTPKNNPRVVMAAFHFIKEASTKETLEERKVAWRKATAGLNWQEMMQVGREIKNQSKENLLKSMPEVPKDTPRPGRR